MSVDRSVIELKKTGSSGWSAQEHKLFFKSKKHQGTECNKMAPLYRVKNHICCFDSVLRIPGINIFCFFMFICSASRFKINLTKIYITQFDKWFLPQINNISTEQAGLYFLTARYNTKKDCNV